MAVRLQFINLIIPIRIIEEKCEGGLKAVLAGMPGEPGGRTWHDDYLYRDGAMNPMDIERLVGEWEKRGLEPFEKREDVQVWKDMCVVEAFCGGPTLPCDWIVFSSADDCVYMKGTEKGEIIGWKELSAG